MAHRTTRFALSLTDATNRLKYRSQYLTHLPSTHASNLGDLQSSKQPTRVHVNAYWTHPAAHSAVCNLRLWNSIPSASATRGAPLGYFLFKLLSFLLLRPIFKVAATYNSKRTAGPSIMLFISERTYAQTGPDKFTVLEGTEYHVRKCGGVS